MGKAGRIACITLPYLLTIASLICIILVGMGTTSKSSQLDDLYFMKADLRNFSLSSTTSGLSSAESTIVSTVESQINVKDFYIVGLWNYCSGDYTDSEWEVTNCSSHQAKYYFNPVEVFGLEDSAVENIVPSSLESSLKVYKKVAAWMFIAYAVAFAATIAELIVGVTAICSRWGSLFTTLCSSVSTIFTLAASITATVLHSIVVKKFNSAMESYGISATMGRQIYITTWLAFAFSLGAGLFWLFSSCCCSGRSPYNEKNNRTFGGRSRELEPADKAPYAYEPVQHPYGYGDSAAVPLSQYGENPHTYSRPYADSDPAYTDAHPAHRSVTPSPPVSPMRSGYPQTLDRVHQPAREPVRTTGEV